MHARAVRDGEIHKSARGVCIYFNSVGGWNNVRWASNGGIKCSKGIIVVCTGTLLLSTVMLPFPTMLVQ